MTIGQFLVLCYKAPLRIQETHEAVLNLNREMQDAKMKITAVAAVQENCPFCKRDIEIASGD